MKSLTEHLWFEIKARRGFVNITGTVEELVLRSGVNEGILLCNATHLCQLHCSDALEHLEHGCVTPK
jgi:thiamine phosphate synthase YjbQ (UPF0047 family)